MREIHQLHPEAQEGLRRRALAALSAGRSSEELARELYVPQQLIVHWWRTHQRHLRARLIHPQAPRPSRHQQQLLKREQAALRTALLEYQPAALGLDTFLWTRQAVADLAQHMFRARLSFPIVANYLRAWEWRFLRPLHQPEHAQWRRDVWPHICTTAHVQQARILHVHHASRLLHPHTPETSPHITVISAQAPRRHLWFALYPRRFTTPVLLEFLDVLLRQVPERLHLVLPPGTLDHNKKANSWLARRHARLTVHQIPEAEPLDTPREMCQPEG